MILSDKSRSLYVVAKLSMNLFKILLIGLFLAGCVHKPPSEASKPAGDQQPYIQGFYPVIQLTLPKRYGIMTSDMDAGAAIITAEKAESVLEFSKQHYR